MTLLSGDFSISNNDVFDDIHSCLNTDDLELVPCVTSASVASGKENRCQNQFNQVTVHLPCLFTWSNRYNDECSLKRTIWLADWKGNLVSGWTTSSSSHGKVTCSCHDIAEKIAELALNNNHSLTH
jgi:hypothetical protein